MKLFDMHCHLDFLEDPRGFADAAALRGLGFFAATVEPAGYRAVQPVLAGAPNVCLGVGLHPWWVHDGRCGMDDAEEVCRLLSQTRYVGEVGIDLGKRCAASQDAQVAVFERIALGCANEGGKVITVHAVHAADVVLDVLERTGCLAGNRVIFHWYSDTSEGLWRAVRAGCYFSLNARMLSTRRGREYARILPLNRVLLETDLPPEEEPAFALEAWEDDLHSALSELEAIRGRELAAIVQENAYRCLQ